MPADVTLRVPKPKPKERRPRLTKEEQLRKLAEQKRKRVERNLHRLLNKGPLNDAEKFGEFNRYCCEQAQPQLTHTNLGLWRTWPTWNCATTFSTSC